MPLEAHFENTVNKNRVTLKVQISEPIKVLSKH